MNSEAKDHIIIFPFMAKGHTIPLLQLTNILTIRNIHVTLITTPANAPFIQSHIPSTNTTILTIPFPDCPSLPKGIESTDTLPSPQLYPLFLHATTLLRNPFTLLLNQLCTHNSHHRRPLCLISDFFLGWTLPVCQELGLPRLVSHGMSVFSMAISKSMCLHRPFDNGEGDFTISGLSKPELKFKQDEVSVQIRHLIDLDDPVTQVISEVAAFDHASWGVVVNSFAEIDKDYVQLFESFYDAEGAKAWLVGPLLLAAPVSVTELDDPEECLKWLDGKPPNSVVYVSFGTQTHVANTQLDEVFHGLVESGQQFVWVVRSESWIPPTDFAEHGKIVRGWCPQAEILAHEAVGGFVSHCGWNSVLESLSAGVPIIAWPMMAEQALNAKHVVEILGVGVKIREHYSDEIVARENVKDSVNKIMVNDGISTRERMVELQRLANEAVAKGGSSYESLELLLKSLRDRS